ncbi:MAG: aldehyde dehydrogenase family protein, partial [Marinicaulis sp.]|nr:aldehyde dehydrogenase family protein [Marinicaulis sp.]
MPLDDISTENAMQSLLSKQKAAQLKEGAPTAAVRIDRLDRAINLLVENSDALNDAVSTDFGHRSKDVTAFADTATSIAQLKFAKKHLRQWMKAERRSVEFPFGLLGASARVEFQPKGVVGVIAPWNFPVGMVFGPLAGVIAAGNRAMIKPSEFTENTSGLMKKIVADAFDETEVAVVTGGPEIGAAFTKLPFDHIVFTG